VVAFIYGIVAQVGVFVMILYAIGLTSNICNEASTGSAPGCRSPGGGARRILSACEVPGGVRGRRCPAPRTEPARAALNSRSAVGRAPTSNRMADAASSAGEAFFGVWLASGSSVPEARDL
jgi:hypothetical protein